MAVTVFVGARVLPCAGADALEDASVVVENGEIKEVASRAGRVPAGEVIDCRGRTLMPGLIDAHVDVCLLDVEIARQQYELRSCHSDSWPAGRAS